MVSEFAKDYHLQLIVEKFVITCLPVMLLVIVVPCGLSAEMVGEKQ